MGVEVAGDDDVGEAIAESRGKTAEALRRDREAMFPATSSAKSKGASGGPKSPERAASDKLGPVPKGFDPYMMNDGRGAHDSRDIEKNIGSKYLAWQCSLQ